MRIRIALSLLACCFIANSYGSDQTAEYELYLVRHAEKQADAGRDPGLNEAGKQRARNLASWLKDKSIEDIWSSDYRRTRNTAEPLVSATGIELKIYNAGDLNTLSEKLLANKNNAYVVGHSNSTPDLARDLCQCAIDDIEESEYDRLIIISVSNNGTTVKTLRQRKLFIIE